MDIDNRNPQELNDEELRQRIAWQKGQLSAINAIIKVLKKKLEEE